MTQQNGSNSSGDTKRKGLLDGLSLSQVVAGALAAVTSVTLSSKIGIAGSLIGVAVASVVSTVASQLYRAMLRRGSDKLRELASSDAEKGVAEQDNPYGIDATGQPGASPSAAPGAGNAPAPRVAPASLREAAHLRHQQTIHRRVMVAAVVSSLAAVGLTAAIILAATHGEGLGERVGAPSVEAASTTRAAQTPATKTSEVATTPDSPEHATTSSSASDDATKGAGEQPATPNATSPTTGDANESVPDTPAQDASGTQDGSAANQ